MAIARLSVGVGSKGKAAPHAQYIAREGKYSKANDDLEKLEFKGHGNMPKWSEHEPNYFWEMSDEHERKNGSTYREHVIALPRELSIDQRHDLIKEWITQELGDKHAYQYAIHNPSAMDGEEQPHCHLMFSERTRDGIERDPDQYFKRFNAKNPDRGGARKANTGIAPVERKKELKAQRDRWEKMCNSHLELSGSTSRITMKSFKDRGFDYKPLNLTMEQIKKPEIKNAYIDHLKAKRSFLAAARVRHRIDISAELSRQAAEKAAAAKMAQQAAEKAAVAKMAQQAAEKATAAKMAQQAAEKAAAAKTAQQAAEKAAAAKMAQQAAEKEAAKMAQQAAEKEAAKMSIKERTPFDLINIRLDVSVTRPNQYIKDSDLSGEMPIGAELYTAIDYMKRGFDVHVVQGDNLHIENSVTAERIKDFMLKKLQNRAVVIDYGELTIEKFTNKYNIECDLNDLIALNEQNLPEKVIEPTQVADNHTTPSTEPKPRPNTSYDNSSNYP